MAYSVLDVLTSCGRVSARFKRRRRASAEFAQLPADFGGEAEMDAIRKQARYALVSYPFPGTTYEGPGSPWGEEERRTLRTPVD